MRWLHRNFITLNAESQMLQAVQVVHEEKIVHSDLKPANFVLVKGQLKLIDFGIANVIANDTTNIQRDHQVGVILMQLGPNLMRHHVGWNSKLYEPGSDRKSGWSSATLPDDKYSYTPLPGTELKSPATIVGIFVPSE